MNNGGYGPCDQVIAGARSTKLILEAFEHAINVETNI